MDRDTAYRIAYLLPWQWGEGAAVYHAVFVGHTALEAGIPSCLESIGGFG